ncbi:DUF1428 domain-containing protein [Paraglaciecola aestuariivivens]
MSNYIDGFVFPIAQKHLDEYWRLAKAVAEVWKEHGAIDYFEYVSDDMQLDGTRSFIDAVVPKPDEVIIFGWVVFESREARDLANKKVASDIRMSTLIDTFKVEFNAERMLYGGFRHPSFLKR